MSPGGIASIVRFIKATTVAAALSEPVTRSGPGATHVAEWDADKDGPSRYFRGSSWFVDRGGPIDHDITVEIYGSQGTAGDVTRHIMVTEGNYERMELSSSDHVREFAAHSSPPPTSGTRWPTTTLCERAWSS
jgi:hypothetical protein